MRLTINLENDHYLIAKALAKEADCSISAAVNDLIRRALAADNERIGQSNSTQKNGFPIVSGKKAFTSQDVDSIELKSM